MYLIRLLSVILLISIVTNCSENKMKTAFINGKIYTVNDKQPTAEAVIIEGNKIVFVGSNDDAHNKIDENTKVVDLKGKLMLPGFIDSHLHFISGGNYLHFSHTLQTAVGFFIALLVTVVFMTIYKLVSKLLRKFLRISKI